MAISGIPAVSLDISPRGHREAAIIKHMYQYNVKQVMGHVTDVFGVTVLCSFFIYYSI
jgi:hypothetical protein